MPLKELLKQQQKIYITTKNFSYRGTSPPRPLPSPWGNDSHINRRRDDRPRDHVKLETRSLSRVSSATSRRHVELSCARTSSWAAMRVLPARRQVAGVPHWHAQRQLTRRRGDTAVAPALGASAQGVPQCALRLPGPQDPDRGDGPLLARFLRLKPRTRALRVPRSPVPLRWPACLGVSSL